MKNVNQNVIGAVISTVVFIFTVVLWNNGGYEGAVWYYEHFLQILFGGLCIWLMIFMIVSGATSLIFTGAAVADGVIHLTSDDNKAQADANKAGFADEGAL